jgi:ABC-2 type transport system permease protein
MTVCAIITLLCITLLCATLGLVINLKMPNLKWTNEIVAVKQSFSVLLAMFACWGVSLLVIGGYFLFGKYLYAEVYLALVSSLFLVVAALLWGWVYKRGTRLFEAL